MEWGYLVKYKGIEVFFKEKTAIELERLMKNHDITLKELLDRYYIADTELYKIVKELGISYNGDIPESETNPHRLTPRHVQVTFGGEYRVICGK